MQCSPQSSSASPSSSVTGSNETAGRAGAYRSELKSHLSSSNIGPFPGEPFVTQVTCPQIELALVVLSGSKPPSSVFASLAGAVAEVDFTACAVSLTPPERCKTANERDPFA